MAGLRTFYNPGGMEPQYMEIKIEELYDPKLLRFGTGTVIYRHGFNVIKGGPFIVVHGEVPETTPEEVKEDHKHNMANLIDGIHPIKFKGLREEIERRLRKKYETQEPIHFW